MSKISVLGIDLAKNVFELCGQDARGKVVFRRRVRRSKLMETLVNIPPCLVGMEACSSAHYWARRIRELGHRVRLMPAQYVKAYVQGNKTDRNDAAAICEAASRRHVPEVAVKSPEQQALQAYHRVRSSLVKQRTALSNALRGLLAEFGLVERRGEAALGRLVRDALANEDLPGLLRESLQIQWSQYLQLSERIAEMDRRLEQVARAHPLAEAMLAVPGIGPKTATALIAGVGDVRVFRRGRQMAAWLGLVPRQHSSGDTRRLGGISKRGDPYLRGLLIHGARSALRSGRDDPQLRWARRLAQRCGHNKAVVALANKQVRILWAMMTTGEAYRHAA